MVVIYDVSSKVLHADVKNVIRPAVVAGIRTQTYIGGHITRSDTIQAANAQTKVEYNLWYRTGDHDPDVWVPACEVHENVHSIHALSTFF